MISSGNPQGDSAHQVEFGSNAYFLNFLGNGVLPKGIVVLTVKVNCLTDYPWNLYAEFVGPLKVARVSLLHERYNSIAFPKDMRNPPIKGWLIVNAAELGKFSGFNRVQTLQVRGILS
jgi:hypothetical protein